jgi:hypothetical protein
MPSSFLAGGREVNVYAMPALLTLGLLVVETIFLAVALPETRGTRVAIPQESSEKPTNGTTNGISSGSVTRASVQDRLRTLKVLKNAHFLFLGLFSGIEFSLTFLTFDRELLITMYAFFS